MKNLKQQIDELNRDLAAQLPAAVLEVFAQSIQDLKGKNIEGKSVGINAIFPDFSLPNTANETVQLKTLLKKGKVVLAFFRGSWCPYCNLELKALQHHLKQLTDRQVSLVAISPQMADYSKELKADQQLDFDLLTDKNNTLAKQLGIDFGLQEEVIPVYESLGIKLPVYNGNDSNELPVPAVFVVDTGGRITYRFADANYMNRLNIDELLEQL
ncbi:peroxiredoxin-like family protein [Sphingobacterium ginsenosidimutans]|uniref:thioredoxin-dependent peroxiredoxin n=1 Tax=Sphingobacterium ginsenosidimutans TaxID=687845 RepID=A0ABP8A6D4_9SPHI